MEQSLCSRRTSIPFWLCLRKALGNTQAMPAAAQTVQGHQGMKTLQVIPKETLDDPESPPLPSAQERAEAARIHYDITGDKGDAIPATRTESNDSPDEAFPLDE